MALLKQVNTGFSNTQTIYANYFQISQLNITEKQGLQAVYAGYVSKEDCQAGCKAIVSSTTQYINFQELKVSIHDSLLIEKIDKHMIGNPPFEGAVYDADNVTNEA